MAIYYGDLYVQDVQPTTYTCVLHMRAALDSMFDYIYSAISPKAPPIFSSKNFRQREPLSRKNTLAPPSGKNWNY